MDTDQVQSAVVDTPIAVEAGQAAVDPYPIAVE